MNSFERSQNNDSIADTQRTFRKARRLYEANLRAAKDSRFIRRRPRRGGTGDAQIKARDLWAVRETARDMVQNDVIPAQAMTRLADNLIGNGFRVEPMTSDPVINAELTKRFEQWSKDKTACDIEARRDFHQIEYDLVFQEVMDGDIFSVLTDMGHVQVIEGDRCMSPSHEDKGEGLSPISLGVERNSAGAPVAYWFTNQTVRTTFAQPKDMQRIPRFDQNGLEVVTHLFSPNRFTESRGYSWWHPLMTETGILDDLDFAALLKAQNASSITGIIENEEGADGTFGSLGSEETVVGDDGVERTITKIEPGLLLELKQGKKLTQFTPSITNDKHFEHTKYTLRKVGAAIHVPYLILLMDASDANFSSMRGVMEAIRVTYTRIQNKIVSQFHIPVWKWLVTRWAADMGLDALGMLQSGELFRHKWIRPAWRYLDPLKDVQADKLALDNRLKSPSGLAGERGMDYNDMLAEIIRDNGLAIESAVKMAIKLMDTFKDVDPPITWQDVLRWGTGPGISMTGELQTKEDGDAVS